MREPEHALHAVPSDGSAREYVDFWPAGTVAKTVSAYDTAVSDAHYGPTKRYVSRERLGAMLDHEFAQLRRDGVIA